MHLIATLTRTASACLLALLLVTPAQTTRAVAQTTAVSTPAQLLDINTATRDQLKGLPGIGDAYADRIIRGRPYTAKNQLTQRGILPDGTYTMIQKRIIARQPAR